MILTVKLIKYLNKWKKQGFDYLWFSLFLLVNVGTLTHSWFTLFKTFFKKISNFNSNIINLKKISISTFHSNIYLDFNESKTPKSKLTFIITKKKKKTI